LKLSWGQLWPANQHLATLLFVEAQSSSWKPKFAPTHLRQIESIYRALLGKAYQDN